MSRGYLAAIATLGILAGNCTSLAPQALVKCSVGGSISPIPITTFRK